MPVAHQIILGIIVAGFVIYPLALFFAWIVTRGWEPMNKPEPEAAHAVEEPALQPELARAA